MKKSILLTALLLFVSCGTLNKVKKSVYTEQDTSSLIRRDTSSVVKKDSSVHSVDKSLITTHEVITNDINIPGVGLRNAFDLSKLLHGGQRIVSSPDGNDSLALSYNTKDSTIIATLVQKARILHQTIDRTVTNQQDKTIDRTGSESTALAGSSFKKQEVISKKREADTTVVAKSSPFPTGWVIIGGVLIALGGALFLAWKFKEKII